MAVGARSRRFLKWVFLLALLYGTLAYIALPRLWSHFEHQPDLAKHPAVTTTTAGIPGDPLNVGFVGSKADIILAMHAAA